MHVFSTETLAGRSVLLTGAAGALGAVIVPALLTAGAWVLATDLVPDEDAAAVLGSHPRLHYLRADTTDEGDVARAFEAAEQWWGRPVDTTLAHAGIVSVAPVVGTSLEQWREVQRVNVEGSFLVLREALRRAEGVARSDHLHKVVVTTSWVQEVPWPDLSAYNASKAALRQLVRSAAREAARSHVRVNAVAPGIVDAGMARREWDANPDYRRRAQRAIPVGFLQPPQSVADAVIFLCSSASDYVTGTTLLVDGGASLYPEDDLEPDA